jgi:uncharacterized membrane-anchored protein YhcB (DUF1043 family)
MQLDQDSIEAMRNTIQQPQNFNLWSWLAWGFAAIVTSLGTTVGVLYRATETRNAKDIANLTAQCERLQKRVDELSDKVADLTADKARLEGEKQWLHHEYEELKQQMAQYRIGNPERT